jgi:hypothetical protein
VLPAGVRMRIVIYLGVLLVLLGFGSPGGGLIGLPISFLLKNKLHLEAHEMAIFGLIAAAPSYVWPSFLDLRATPGIRSACGTAASWSCSAACARPYTCCSPLRP